MTSVTAVLPVPANANLAPSTAAKPADDDFHAVLASYAPAQDRAAPRNVAKSGDSAPRATAKRDVKDARPDPIARDGNSKGPKKDAHAGKADSGDAQANAQAQPTAVVVQQTTPAILRDVTAAQPLVAANSDDIDAGDADTSFDAQTLASATDVPVASAATPTQHAPVLPSADTTVSNGTKNSPAAKHDVNTRDDAGRQASPIQNAPAKTLPCQAADALAAVTKTNPQPQTSSPAPQAAPQATQPLQSSILTMLNAMRGAITVTLSPKQAAAPAADAKPDTIAKPDTAAKPDVAARPDDTAKPDETAEPASKSVAEPSSASPKSNAAIKRADLAPIVNLTTGDDDNTQPVSAPVQNASKPASAPAAAKPDAANASAKPDPRAITHDDSITAAVGSVSDKSAPSPVTTQPATAEPQPSNAPVVAIAPNVATSAPSAPSQVGAPVPSMHLPREAAMQPNLAALATAIAVKSASGTKTFDIRMDPPELGRVDVHLSVDRDGKVQAMLSAEHPQTLLLMQRDSQSLERSLRDAGLNLSNNSLNFSLKGEGRQGDGGGASTARARSLPDAVVARAEAANASVSNFNFASGNGRLDIRV